MTTKQKSAEEAPPTQPAPTGPQILRREAWVDLPQEAYPGFKLRVWLNHPFQLQQDLMGTDPEKSMSALRRVALEHNGWRDYDGSEYPAIEEDAFWEQIPTELASCVIALTRSAPHDLPKSLLPTPRSRS